MPAHHLLRLSGHHHYLRGRPGPWAHASSSILVNPQRKARWSQTKSAVVHAASIRSPARRNRLVGPHQPRQQPVESKWAVDRRHQRLRRALDIGASASRSSQKRRHGSPRRHGYRRLRITERQPIWKSRAEVRGSSPRYGLLKSAPSGAVWRTVPARRTATSERIPPPTEKSSGTSTLSAGIQNRQRRRRRRKPGSPIPPIGGGMIVHDSIAPAHICSENAQERLLLVAFSVDGGENLARITWMLSLPAGGYRCLLEADRPDAGAGAKSKPLLTMSCRCKPEGSQNSLVSRSFTAHSTSLRQLKKPPKAIAQELSAALRFHRRRNGIRIAQTADHLGVKISRPTAC